MFHLGIVTGEPTGNGLELPYAVITLILFLLDAGQRGGNDLEPAVALLLNGKARPSGDLCVYHGQEVVGLLRADEAVDIFPHDLVCLGRNHVSSGISGNHGIPRLLVDECVKPVGHLLGIPHAWVFELVTGHADVIEDLIRGYIGIVFLQILDIRLDDSNIVEQGVALCIMAHRAPAPMQVRVTTDPVRIAS
ncbi:MAG: hypothetical protein BWX71_00365 [Deltaproteobacteria bacterium ADurb.Bin072]|nr:MAG: hypothetical protein BWX71_00365 [Deltaproteobacteria bacterium ADurb.Bin072]